MPKDDIDELIAQLFAVSRLIRECFAKHKGADLYSMLQLKVLNFISERTSPPMKDVAQHFGITPPTATVIINRLVKTGQLQRVLDVHDRRIVRLSITERGAKNLRSGFQRVGERMRTLFKDLSPAERKQFTNILIKISKQESRH